MAQERTAKFTEAGARRIVAAVRQVEASGKTGQGSQAGPRGTAPQQDVWLELYDWDGSPDENTYSANVYLTPYGGTPLGGYSGVKAWNIWEKGNHEGLADAYEIIDDSDGSAECGSIIGIEDLPTNIRYKALWFGKRDDDYTSETWGFSFSQRRDPVIKEEP